MFGAGAVAVEIVAALTVVTVSGVTVGWRSAIEGTIAAVVLLAARVTVVGAPPARLIPIDTLRFAIGALLLVLGLDRLRKAVLGASDHKPLHDEDAICARTVPPSPVETWLLAAKACPGRGGAAPSRRASRSRSPGPRELEAGLAVRAAVLMTRLVRALGTFGRFWKDFLIDDAPELFIGALAFIGAALALCHTGAIAVVAVALIVIVFVGRGVLHGRASPEAPAILGRAGFR